MKTPKIPSLALLLALAPLGACGLIKDLTCEHLDVGCDDEPPDDTGTSVGTGTATGSGEPKTVTLPGTSVVCDSLAPVANTGHFGGATDDCQCTFEARSNTFKTLSILVESKGEPPGYGYLEHHSGRNSGSARGWSAGNHATGPHKNTLVGEYDVGGTWTYSTPAKNHAGAPIACDQITDVVLNFSYISSFTTEASQNEDGETEGGELICVGPATIDLDLQGSPMGLMARPRSSEVLPVGAQVQAIELLEAGAANQVTIKRDGADISVTPAAPMAQVDLPMRAIRFAIGASGPGEMPAVRLHTTCAPQQGVGAPIVSQGYAVDPGLAGLAPNERLLLRVASLEGGEAALEAELVGFPALAHGVPMQPIAPDAWHVDYHTGPFEIVGTVTATGDQLMLDLDQFSAFGSAQGPVQLTLPAYP